MIDKQIEFGEALGLPIIDTNRNYWFVRTQGGYYFDDFYFGNYISVEWDDINDLSLITDNEKENQLREKIEKLYPNSKTGAIVTNLKRFVNDMAKGDIVVIPSSNSEFLAFGEISTDEILTYIPDIDRKSVV